MKRVSYIDIERLKREQSAAEVSQEQEQEEECPHCAGTGKKVKKNAKVAGTWIGNPKSPMDDEDEGMPS